MGFKLFADVAKLLEDDRHGSFHRNQVRTGFLFFNLGQRGWCANAGNHIFALRIDQIFAIEPVFAG